MEPFLVHEPTSDTKLIVEAHPMLVPQPDTCASLVANQNHGWLLMVSPSTLLTQSPLTEVGVEQKWFSQAYRHAGTHRFVLKREGGVTFGDVVEEMRAQCAEELAVDTEKSLGRRSPKADKSQPDPRCTRIEAWGVVAETSNCVRAARGRLEQERQSSG